jgi:hypothetical protein
MGEYEKFTICGLWVKRWSKDSWTSIILVGTWMAHPDKLGHFLAHLFVTLAWLWLGLSWYHALLADAVLNTMVEVVDGTRPRRTLGGRGIKFLDQEAYEDYAIEGFSIKDWIAGLVGSGLAVGVWSIFLGGI